MRKGIGAIRAGTPYRVVDSGNFLKPHNGRSSGRWASAARLTEEDFEFLLNPPPFQVPRVHFLGPCQEVEHVTKAFNVLHYEGCGGRTGTYMDSP